MSGDEKSDTGGTMPLLDGMDRLDIYDTIWI
jgi:hypothetical protein